MDLLAHLDAYVAAVDEASFSRAAERLGIAQPLLSRRIKTLEEHFEGQLFDRSRRQVAATELGLLLLPYAREVLDRAQRLRHVARSARQSAVRAVGVPADCGPDALARIIRAGAEHGTTFGVRELPPEEREAGLADASLAYALVRVPPENAGLRVPLGLASAPPDAPGGGRSAVPGERPRTRRHAVHLEDLRPRRGGGTRPGRVAAVPVLAMAEEHVPYARDRLRRAVARAGLPEAMVRSAGPTATALAETLAGQAMLLCAEPFARRHGARWAPLADASLHRGYDVRAAHRDRGPAQVPPWLVGLLAAAVGAATGEPAVAAAESAGEDAPSRLAARG
ncbi:LysR family transcriptional regulator [Streptomyces sp. NRRL F-4489]|uniref:LysR family transcriptional regulator n=1 Tax=Streptomyces sp. NRRL F-4489 TaxID=1609095 RepID=UPI0007467956|nr:LysR family transcriptional regulator [Streptomyces sp. NRRL F-4489]KUL38927.1 LysR family transcriptional regulator [Streptomyces sp. NRRL F-4489]